MKLEKIFIQSIDEFNYTSVVNFSENINSDSGVLCLPGFEILFYNFENIILSKLQNIDGVLLDNDLKRKGQVFKSMESECLSLSKKILSQSSINFNGEHIYKFMFKNLGRDMKTKNSSLYTPIESDYLETKSRLNNINKKIVVINGRNLSGNRSGRNNLMVELIAFLLNSGFYVINCTIPTPFLQSTFNNQSYLEINEKELINYSKNISYFVNADCVISVANSAGITNHICCDANFILFGEGGWVDNREFGYNNQSLYEISKSIKPTYKTNNFYEIEFLLNQKLSKPKMNNFFNIQKIKYYGL